MPLSVLPPARFRPDIEGLRAIAVLLVVAAHTGLPGVQGGFVGVDVFFVISGFLITSLLLREAERTGRISVPRFYARRAMRLLPAAAVVLVATLIAARLLMPLTRLGEFGKDALAATGYFANLRFAAIGTDYLQADQAPSPFQHFWSLAVEEQFYLVWPLLILAGAHLWRRRRPLAAVLAVLSVTSFVLSITETARSAPWAYFGPHTRAWELGAGALLALGIRRVPKSALLGWAGLGAILLAAVLFDDSTAYPSWRALLPVAGAVALLAAGDKAQGVGWLLGLRPMQAIGRLSYSWYLWHWPVLMMFPAARTWQKLLLAVGALGLAWLTYRFVENPLRHRRRPALRSLSVGAAFSAAVAATAVLLVLLPHGVESAGRRADLRHTLATAKDPAAELARAIEASRAMGALPANLLPKLTKAARDRPRVWDNGCHADTPVTVAPTGCVFGDLNGAETVVLFGDSHAAQWFPAMEALATQRHWRLVELTKTSCTAADLPVWHDTLKRAYTECQAFHASALDRIARLRPSLVVIGSSFNYRPAQPAADVAGQWRAAWDRTFGALEATGARVAAIADTPYMGGPVPECLAEPANAGHAGKCTRSLRSALRGPEQRQVFLAYAGRPRTTVINPITWFCTDACPPVVGNLLVYRDSNHMTTTYSAALAPLLGARLPVLAE
ncbi:acyltransferase family protein [Actinoplanes sp. NPDC026619]|uniref:acyltransferase family protein n=1 Tax=Actinoplanes sp. NPDC026619 TaxID=3155798 RepID=UPI0033F706D4